MAYSVPPLWVHGDIPTAANMNKYKDGLTSIYSSLGSGRRHICSAVFRQYETRASDTHNDGMAAHPDYSYCVSVHLWRWLFYSGEGTITSIDSVSSTSLQNDNPSTYNVFDLDSVDWLLYGGIYRINSVKWAFEDWEP